MTDDDDSHPPSAPPQAEIRRELYELRLRHADLDAAIRALEEGPGDAFTIRRLKKRKLALKDRISALEDALLPDIIA